MFVKKVNHHEMAKKAALAGFLEAGWILIVSFFFLISPVIFAQAGWGIIIGTMSFLILLVMSVVISALLMLGYPIYFAMQKQYQEAVICIASSAGALLSVFIVLAFISIFIF